MKKIKHLIINDFSLINAFLMTKNKIVQKHKRYPIDMTVNYYSFVLIFFIKKIYILSVCSSHFFKISDSF